jgi:hypothetical protein
VAGERNQSKLPTVEKTGKVKQNRMRLQRKEADAADSYVECPLCALVMKNKPVFLLFFSCFFPLVVGLVFLAVWAGPLGWILL